MIDFSREDPRWSYISAEITQISSKTESERLFILDGLRMQTWIDLMQEFEQVMAFPSYFGRNIPALVECLQDLDWCPAKSYRTVIRSACKVLSANGKEDQVKFFNLLNKTSLEWAKGTLPGANWTREETAFRVVLQDDLSCIVALQKLIISA